MRDRADQHGQAVDRRTYLRVVGTASVVGVTGVAGCLGGGGDGEEMSIVAGTAPGFPPFEMREGGDLVGFDIDLLEAVVEQTDYTLAEWQTFDFKSLVPALTNENIDVIAAALSINPDRDETIDFTDPYYSVDQAILVRAGGSFQPSALEDLSGHPVGAQKGTTGEDQLEQLVEEGNLTQSNQKAYDSYVLAVQDLENGNIDAVVVDTPVAETFVADRNVEIAFTVTTGESYGFGVREDDDDLTDALNSGLQTVRDDGTYEEITRTWFGGE